MKKHNCDLCEKEIPNTEDIKYSMTDHRNEVNSVKAMYCGACWLILDGKTKIGSKRSVRKVKINTSFFPLPGFVLSKDKTYFVRKKK